MNQTGAHSYTIYQRAYRNNTKHEEFSRGPNCESDDFMRRTLLTERTTKTVTW